CSRRNTCINLPKSKRQFGARLRRRRRGERLDANDILLTDQVAIVTGGGGGIGRAIALAFASVGANLVIGDIVPERCEETANRVRELGRKALAVPTDVMESTQVRA